MMNRLFLLRAAHRRLTPLAAGLLVLLIGGCTDTGIEPLPEEPLLEEHETIVLPGLVISEPRSVVAGAGALASAGPASAAPMAYVSAEPGTFPGAAQIRIRNLNTADAGTFVTVQEGGFDPVGIPASTGDLLELFITDFSGAFRYARVDVPARRPPVIVRTNPPKGRTDVAFSIRPVVIFSEPIDPQSLDETAITLLRDGVVVSGAVALLTGSPFAVELTPEALLEPLTAYELVVATAVRDLDGESLAEEYRVPFTTGSHGGAGGFRISNVTTGGAFDVDGYQVRVTVAGQAPRTVELELNTSVVIGDLPPGDVVVELYDVAANCSVSGESSRTVAIRAAAEVALEFQAACKPPPELGAVRLVFSRREGVHPTAGLISRLWAMNADGTDLRQLTDGESCDYGPIVSPDGARIAFSRCELVGWGDPGVSTYLMDADGSYPERLTYGQASSWSPDGSTLAIDDAGSGSGIRLIEANGAGDRTIVAGSHPVWSPDGSRIAFRRDAEGLIGGCDDPTAAHEIWTINTDRTDPILVKRLPPCSWAGHLSWSSDGRILFEDRRPDEVAPLWSIGPDGTGLSRFLEPTPMLFGVFSQDGSLVTMHARRGDIYLMNVADGSIVRVTADGSSGGAAFLR